MKINFIIEGLTGLTGGLVYNEQFYRKLCSLPVEIKLLDDDYFIEGVKNTDNKHHFTTMMRVYTEHSEEIVDCDYLFIDERLYPRFIGFPWKNKAGCKVIAIIHHYNYLNQKFFLKIIHRYFERRFVDVADIVITPNVYTKDVVEKVNNGVRIVILDSHICKDKVENTGIKDNIFLFLGTVEPRKGVHYAIKAFYEFCKKCNDYELYIAGKCDFAGQYYKKLSKNIKKYKLENKIHFCGRVEDEEKDNLLRKTKCFLFPSLNEGYGWVMVEAMRYGVPVIAFDNSAMPYTVNDSNGFLVNNKDAKEMALAMKKIIDDATYKSKIDGAYRTVAELPEKEDIDEKYNSFFEMMIKRTI